VLASAAISVIADAAPRPRVTPMRRLLLHHRHSAPDRGVAFAALRATRAPCVTSAPSRRAWPATTRSGGSVPAATPVEALDQLPHVVAERTTVTESRRS
jgi:hypothetical protein